MNNGNKIAYCFFKDFINSTILLLTILFVLTGCSESLSVKTTATDQISQANWNDNTQVLSIAGKATGEQSSLIVTNDVTKEKVGIASVQKDKTWQVTLSKPAVVPCSVVLSDNRRAVNVENAPINCNRPTRDSVDVNLGREVTQSVYPEGTIILPPDDMSIVPGGVIEFAALGSESNLSYQWEINSGSFNYSSKAQNPGFLKFSQPGKYRVQLTVSNALGIQDLIAEQRIINVVQAGANRISVIAPVASIVEPVGDLSINVGDTVAFVGSATDPDGTGLLAFTWDFAGAVPNSTVQNPGDITFNKSGVYIVSLMATDAAGVPSETSAQVTITVVDSGVNQAPSGLIIQPITNVTVTAGDSVEFEGGGIDPDGDQISFFWNFGEISEIPVDVAAPGMVTFPRMGVFPVTLIVTDVMGLEDSNPPTRTITVVQTNVENSDFPTATILEPIGDVAIMVGDAVIFNGEAASPVGVNDPVTVEWFMTGPDPAAVSVAFSTELMPGPIAFDMAGEYTITFVATDAIGQSNQMPAQVVISVNDPMPTELNGSIDSPKSNITVKVGKTLKFKGDGISPLGGKLIYNWTFGDPAIADVLGKKKPKVIYNTEGTFEVTLTVMDASGAVDSTPATLMVTVEPASGESSIDYPERDLTILTGEKITFEGEGDEGDPLSFAWTTGDSTLDATVPDLTAEEISVTFAMAGVYTVQLTVTDVNGPDPSPAMVVITVEDFMPPPVEPIPLPVEPVPDPGAPPPGSPTDPVPQSPTGIIEAPMGDQVITVGDAVEFIGGGTDPNGDALTYLWNFGGAAPDNSAQSPGMITFDAVGSYDVMLTVSNASGLVDPMPPTVNMTVQEATAPVPDPVPPVTPTGIIEAPASNQVIAVGDAVEFTGGGTDPNGEALTYLWTFGGAAPDDTVQSPGLITFDTAGFYDVMLTVSNASGLIDPMPPTVNITVQEAIAPVPDPVPTTPTGIIEAPASNQVIAVGDAVEFTGGGTDPNGEALTYLWTFGGAVPDDTVQSPGLITFDTAGSYDVMLTVSNASGLIDPMPPTVNITVEEATAPVPDPVPTTPTGIIEAPASNQVITVGDVVEFTGGGTDPNGETLTYLWTFGGAVPDDTVQSPGLITFDTAGSYDVMLTVSNASGLVDPMPPTVNIMVEEATVPAVLK